MTKLFAGAVLMVALAGGSAEAQPRFREVQQRQPRPKQKGKMPGIPAPALRRFLLMSPSERQEAVDRLPPARRAQTEQRLSRLERMPAQERERTLHRLELFDAIPPRRRLLVRDAIQRLRTMPAPARQRYLESEDARLRFDPEELELLRDVSGLPPEMDVQ